MYLGLRPSLPGMVRRGGPRGASRGQAIVELALILPVAIVLLATAADLARLFNSQVVVESAARAGALEAARNPTSYLTGQPCDDRLNRVVCAVQAEAEGSSLSIQSSDIALTCEPSPCGEVLGDRVAVAVTGQFGLITPILAPFVGGQNLILSASAVAQVAVRPNISGASPSPTPAPTPTPLPTPVPTPTPDPGPTVPPAPSPTPACFAPYADFSVSPDSGKKKKTTFDFTDWSSTWPGCPLTWSWNFGDGAGASSTSSLQNPSHVYEAQGTYTVTLVASNFAGPDTKTRTVTVTP